MKTLTKDGKSIYTFDNAEVLDISANNIAVGDPVKFFIHDCNSSNTVLHEGVTPPEDWTGHKYLFNGTDWTLNPDWVDPTTLFP